MSTLTTTPATAALLDLTRRATATARRSQQGIAMRFRAWLAARRRKHVDDAITALVQRHGGVMSDELEREISRRLGGMAGGR